jgi:hypothetical protein
MTAFTDIGLLAGEETYKLIMEVAETRKQFTVLED